ncbi:MAG: T9SS type A sorting domain-containing protein [candidate division WOR-3 bacterium]|nr:T9SS type A sorting domain-containing protein [candidate division WOR-3 bacterium]
MFGKKVVLWLVGLTTMLSAQYSFNFVCVSDTFQTGIDYFIFRFRLTNTGSQPDSYAFDCRVIDSVPGWFELYCAGGQCAEPGIILYSYLTPGAIDSGIDVSIYPATGVWGTEVVNLKVRSVRSPNLRDSITVIAAMEQGVFIYKTKDPIYKFELYPIPFNNYLVIKFRMPDLRLQPSIKIFDSKGQLIKRFDNITSNQSSEIVWRGDDHSGKPVPEGVYFIELKNNGYIFHRKVVKVQ